MSTESNQKIQQLRSYIKEHTSAQGLIIPRTDKYQGEYVAPHDERLMWLTGFSGSAGYAIVLENKAALFVDGRYTLQAQNEVDRTLYDVRHITQSPAEEWLKHHLSPEDTLLYDPWLHTPNDVKKWTHTCKQSGIKFSPISENPIDTLWRGRPEKPHSQIVIHDSRYAGQSRESKIKEIVQDLEKNQARFVILTSPESICWLLNIRGNDLPYVPSISCFAIVHQDSTVDVFLDPRKISVNVVAVLGETIRIHSFDQLVASLNNLKPGKIILDPSQVPSWISNHFEQDRLIFQPDPCILRRAIKNNVEQRGAKKAHLRDGVAVTKFLAWLSQEISYGASLTELDIIDKLEEYRLTEENYRGPSFPTIAGFGKHGAIVHYRATKATNATLQEGGLLLVDSGGQYLDGTTDITRTIAIGVPSAEHRDRFTHVLKGHIALSCAIFPFGTTGSQLDSLARLPLWQIGIDYDHGTGHGVGSYLNVHEGPQRIGKSASTSALHPGMIISNEPGYYKKNDYGIRIENLVMVIEANLLKDSENKMLIFETLTLVPIDLKLVDVDQLTQQERDWLNAYHMKVREKLTPYLDTDTAAWLLESTEMV